MGYFARAVCTLCIVSKVRIVCTVRIMSTVRISLCGVLFVRIVRNDHWRVKACGVWCVHVVCGVRIYCKKGSLEGESMPSREQ